MTSTTFFSNIGKSSLQLMHDIGSASQFFLRSLRLSFTHLRPRLLLHQMIYIGYNSMLITTLTSIFTGMVLAMQLAYQMKQFGALMYVGGTVAVAFTRELGPVLTALVIAGRVGAAITAEIGTMKVTEQIDALETLATDPTEYLVVPRLQAAMLMFPILTVYSDALGILGGYMISAYKLNLSHTLVINNITDFLTLSDVFSGIIKSFFFGLIIVSTGCYKGFKTTSGAEGVGKATTQSVVVASITILIADYFLTAIILMFI